MTWCRELSRSLARSLCRWGEGRGGGGVVGAPRAARPRPPLCGRGAELAALAAAWERARSRRGQLLLVEGEPGEGKTRLIDELVARARLDDATVAVARTGAADPGKSWAAVAGPLSAGPREAPRA